MFVPVISSAIWPSEVSKVGHYTFKHGFHDIKGTINSRNLWLQKVKNVLRGAKDHCFFSVDQSQPTPKPFDIILRPRL